MFGGMELKLAPANTKALLRSVKPLPAVGLIIGAQAPVLRLIGKRSLALARKYI